ncbi:MAG: macro domain-containing protein [Firmicutes bacterium]|mgnify:CR=1 FL=1|nr:macro domain-containing protein [Bacillota bacterium]
MKKEYHGVMVECIKGDIVKQKDMEAIVNAANARLLPGGGVAGAIHRAAGPGLKEECVPLGPIKPGEAVITGAHNLPNKYVIHTLGPVYGVDKPEDEILRNCYRNSLQIAEDRKISSVAFPAISTGIFGYPVAEAAAVALNLVARMARDLQHVKEVRFVLHSDADLAVHEKAMPASNPA